jgi:hypothetical protein
MEPPTRPADASEVGSRALDHWRVSSGGASVTIRTSRLLATSTFLLVAAASISLAGCGSNPPASGGTSQLPTGVTGASTTGTTGVPTTGVPATTEVTASTAAPSPGAPAYQGMNLATAIPNAQKSGSAASYVGGGDFGVIVTSDWTVCFAHSTGASIVFYASKDCTPDSNSVSGPAAQSSTVAQLIGQNLQTAENTLSASNYGYNEIGGGDLGIVLPSDWTVCYAENSAGVTQLYAAKDCTPQAAS